MRVASQVDLNHETQMKKMNVKTTILIKSLIYFLTDIIGFLLYKIKQII